MITDKTRDESGAVGRTLVCEEVESKNNNNEEITGYALPVHKENVRGRQTGR